MKMYGDESSYNIQKLNFKILDNLLYLLEKFEH